MSKKEVDCLFIVIIIRRENLNCSFNSLELEHVNSSCLQKILKTDKERKNVFVESNGYFFIDSKVLLYAFSSFRLLREKNNLFQRSIAQYRTV